MLAFVKDGVIQMLVLMMIYGTLIPNSRRSAARMMVAMFVGPVAAMLLLTFHPGAAPVVAQLSAAEEAGSNILFLGLGAALAIYGALLVNGLRTQLSEARKFRPVPARPKARGRGHGRGLSCRARIAQAALRTQADQARSECRPARPRTVRARGSVVCSAGRTTTPSRSTTTGTPTTERFTT